MKRMALIFAVLIAGLSTALAQQTVTRVGPITPGDCASFQSPNSIQDGGIPCGAGHFANPTATAGPNAINGSATTSMRSDAAPAVQKGTNAQFGIVEGDGTTIDCSVTPGICIAKINGILPTPTRAGDIIYWNGSTWVTLAGNNSGTQILSENSSGVPSWTTAGGTVLTEPQGRITLTANTPVMTASASAQTTLRYDCSIGNQVPYYTGAVDTLDTIASCEVTDAMVSAASAGQVVSGNVYDVWWVHSGANRICLAMSASTGGGGGWASDTAGTNTSRGTGYSQLDRTTRPYTTNKNAIANCFNAATNYGSVPVNQATYLGTVYASGNGQVSYTLGAAGSGGVAGLIGVWNMYNRVTGVSNVTDNGTSYTLTSGTTRQARASAGNQTSIVTGVAEDGVAASYSWRGSTTAVAGAFEFLGIGLDSTTTFLGQSGFMTAPTAAAFGAGATNAINISPQLGLHVYSANEASDGTQANSFNNGTANTLSAAYRW